jgi:hypothetical protein
MTSLQTSIKQVGPAAAYYVPLADIRASIVAYRSDLGRFSTCSWSAQPVSGAGRFSTLVASAGAALLKDMGKTIVSSTRTFRKIQLVAPPKSDVNTSTFGVAGDVNTSADYLTGYIEMGFEGSGAAAAVAKYGA